MQIFSSCKSSIDHCLTTKTYAISHLYSDEKPMDMHIHDCYEIYVSISGGKQFLIDNRFYTIEPGDIFYINQFESHHLTQIESEIHERIVICLHPDYLEQLSSRETDLKACFTTRNGDTSHKIKADGDLEKRIIYLVHKIESAKGYGADLTEQNAFLELMLLLNKAFYQACCHKTETEDEHSNAQVDAILSYINRNIHTPLSLEDLSSSFYLSHSYLCRIFKSATGTTILKYITARRITIAKSLLNEGLSVTEVWEKSGFNDYTNFLKAFTKAVGVSPKKYAKFNT